MFTTRLRQLRVNLKGTDGVYVVAKQVDTEGQFTAIAIDVEDAAAKGKLSWLVDVVHLLETQLTQERRHIVHLYRLTLLQHQRVIAQLFLRHHQFCQRFRIANDEQRGQSPIRGKFRQYFCTQDFVGTVALAVFDGTAITAGEEQHPFLTQQLRQVVVKISGIVGILHHE